jgi:hypothetical protein
MVRIDKAVWLIERAEKLLNAGQKIFKSEFKAFDLSMKKNLGKVPNQVVSNIDFAMVKAVATVGQPEYKARRVIASTSSSFAEILRQYTGQVITLKNFRGTV